MLKVPSVPVQNASEKEKVEKVVDLAKELEKANKVVRKYNRSRSSGCDADKGTDDRARYDGLSYEY